jgi:hypothetical protein
VSNTFPDPVVPTRRELARVFRAVQEETRILMRASWTCCASCGHSDLAKLADEDTLGWAFYHMQAAAHACDSGWVYLHYATSRDDGDASDEPFQAALAHVLVAALQRRGLFVRWSGDGGNTITVAVNGQSFDLLAPGAIDRDGLDGTAHPLDAETFDACEWFVYAWEEVESLDPEHRWKGILVGPDGESRVTDSGTTEDEVVNTLREVWLDILEQLDDAQEREHAEASVCDTAGCEGPAPIPTDIEA